MYRVEYLLVPVDFSQFSRCALTFARRMGETSRDEEKPRLQLGHAIDRMPGYIRDVLFPYAALGEDDRAFEAEIVDAARSKLDQYFEIDEELRGRFADSPRIEFGSSGELISRWAAAAEAEMIVVGAFGEGGVFGHRPGSTSARIASTASQPVALIRDYDPKVNIDNILVTVDLGAQSQAVIDVALGMAESLGASIHLLYVLPSPFVDDTKSIMERQLSLDATEIEEAARPEAEQHLDALVEKVEIPFSRRDDDDADAPFSGRQIGFGDPAEEICRAAYEGGFDLVVVGRGRGDGEGRKGPGRVATAVMADVPCHLVVVPAAPKSTPLDRWRK